MFLQLRFIPMRLTFTSLISPALWHRSFIVLCAATFLLFFSYHLITPVYTAYLTQLGFKGSLLGALVSSFMVASIVTRPFIGKWTDEGDKRAFIAWGTALFMICPLLYPLTHDPVWLMVIRVIHGMAFATFYVASGSLLTDVVADSHRGEGISHYSNMMKLAMAFSPALGVLMLQHHWTLLAFWLSGALGILTWLVVLQHRPTPQSQAMETAKPKGQLINVHAIYPGLIMTANTVVFGALIPFMPLLATEKHLDVLFLFYPIYALCLVLSRSSCGSISDKYGRASVVIPGMTVVLVALWGLAAANSPWLFLLFSGLYGFGAGTVQPALMAMAIDHSPAEHRGSAMATFSTFNDLGIAIGSFMMGSLGSLWSYSEALMAVSVVVFMGWAVFTYRERAVVSVFRQKVSG